MTDFTLTPTALKVIRNLAGRADRSLIAKALDCPVHTLEALCQQHCISLKRDEEQTGVR